MRLIERNGRTWAWPEHDRKLIQVFDWVADIEQALRFVQGRSLAIQAGGACGQWPLALADHFERVITFEPHPGNLACLRENIAGQDRIDVYDRALGAQWGEAAMAVDDFEADNCGAYYLTEGEGVHCMTIDMLMEAPDLIQLDIEGSELDALNGAGFTLRKHRPVVMLEEKPLPQIEDHLAPRRFLEGLGYREVARVHRDVVFAC